VPVRGQSAACAVAVQAIKAMTAARNTIMTSSAARNTFVRTFIIALGIADWVMHDTSAS
jgi:hypothetical protein